MCGLPKMRVMEKDEPDEGMVYGSYSTMDAYKHRWTRIFSNK